MSATDEDLKANSGSCRDVRDRIEETHDAVGRIRDVKAQVQAIGDRAEKLGKGTALKEKGKALSEKLTAIEKKLVNPDLKSNQDVLNFPPALDHQLIGIASAVVLGRHEADRLRLGLLQGGLGAARRDPRGARRRAGQGPRRLQRRGSREEIPPVVVVTAPKEEKCRA